MENRSIVIISLLSDYRSTFIEFPTYIPHFFWQVNRWQNLAQYLTSIAADFRPKQIWIITKQNMIPAMKMNVGELVRFNHVFSKGYSHLSSKTRNMNIPIYYWAHPAHLSSIGKKEKTYQVLYLANKLHETYKKIILSQNMNKFVFLDSGCFFDSPFLSKIKKTIIKSENCLITYKYKNQNRSFLTREAPACLDIKQIKLILKYYESIKKIHRKQLSREEILSCLDESKFANRIEVEMNHNFYAFKTFKTYSSYLKSVCEGDRYIYYDSPASKKNLVNKYIKLLSRRGISGSIRAKFIFSRMEQSKHFMHFNSTRTDKKLNLR